MKKIDIKKITLFNIKQKIYYTLVQSAIYETLEELTIR